MKEIKWNRDGGTVLDHHQGGEVIVIGPARGGEVVVCEIIRI